MSLSRMGRLAVPIPKGATVTLEGLLVTVKGPKGALAREVSPKVGIEIVAETLKVTVPEDTRELRPLHGLTRALIANMVTGVSQGFVKVLEITGVGYRADIKGNVLDLSLGYSHPVRFALPEGITGAVEKQTTIRLEGIDRELLGQTAAKIRALRPGEPYKGKGVKYAGEQIRRKAGKTGKK